MNKEIQPTQENSRILAEFIQCQIDLARKKKYGRAYFEFSIPSAQDLINSIDEDEEKL